MRVTLRLLGLEIIDLNLTTDSDDNEAEETEDRVADHVGTLIGFTPSPGDQRWEPCADFGEDDET